MPTSTHTEPPNVIERYQNYRTARFLRRERTWSTALPKWRTRTRRRALVIALGATFAFMAVIATVCAFGYRQVVLLWLPACVFFYPLWIAVQIVSGRRGDAPRDALDEFEIERRNSARSIGLTLTQNLMLIPIGYLIFASALEFGDGHEVAYAGGLGALTVLLIGGCAPAMILAWIAPDPEPE